MLVIVAIIVYSYFNYPKKKNVTYILSVLFLHGELTGCG